MPSRPTIDATALDELGRFFAGKNYECGGILGGKDYKHISVYSHDTDSYCDLNEYRPNTEHLSHIVEDWFAKGLVMLGFVHSHPPHASSLSSADILYAKEFLRLNTTVLGIYMGIVTNDQLFLYLLMRKNSRVPDEEVYIHEKYIYPIAIH